MDPSNDGVIKLSQSTDYLGFLNKQLRDLRGISTLANELIQNADDVPRATRIEFDITDDKLIVSNDSTFSDCGHADQYQCAYGETGSRKMCDFHAFRNIASGHKREEQDTTGAFGIGFISVYQITDRPSLQSGQWQWSLFPDHEESERIHATRISPAFNGTRFELPWAKERTRLRTKLDVDPVPEDMASQILAEMPKVLKAAAPFLKRLETLILKQDGREVFAVTCVRDDEAGEILVEWDGNSQTWLKLRGNFDEEGSQLRQQHRAIEEKRKTEVTVAVPLEALKPGENSDGLFYAFLPTEQTIGVPVLINADFYPSTDRKRLLFERDYQGAWNNAAIKAAARILAGNILNLRDCLKPADLWQLFMKAKELHRLAEQGKVTSALASFWNCIKPVIETEAVVYTVGNRWLPTRAVRNLQQIEEEESIIPFLSSLGIQVVHPDLRSSYSLLSECNVQLLSLFDVIEKMEEHGLNEVIEEEDIPTWLRNPGNGEVLGQELDRLLSRIKKEDRDSARERLKQCSFVYADNGALVPPKLVRRSLDRTCSLFELIDGDICWVSSQNCPEVLGFVDEFNLTDAITVLEKADLDDLLALYQKDRGFIKDLIRWLISLIEYHAANPIVLGKIKALNIWPSGGALKPLTQLSVPGDFDDPLHLANLLEMDVVGGNRQFLIDQLGATELNLTTYVTQHIPSVFQNDGLPRPELIRSLVDLLSIHIGLLRGNDPCAKVLASCELVECTDGRFRKPGQVYFEAEIVAAVLGEDAPVALLPKNESEEPVTDLYDWLGVSSLPRTVDIIDRVERLVEQSQTETTRVAIENIISGIAEHWESFEEDEEDFETLKEIAWLPVTGSDEWYKPSDVFTTYRRYLFSSQAAFLNISRTVEINASDFFDFLGIETNPSVKQVIDHLLFSSENNDEVNKEVYTFLNNNIDDPLVVSLRSKACILLEGRGYVSPAHVFWGQHPFGQYRERLGESWRKQSELLNKIGVREEPDEVDAIDVLIELSDKFGEYNSPLSEDDKNIVLSCWQILSRKLEGEDVDIDLSRLQECKTVPDAHSILSLPDTVFFEDRPRLATRFGSQLERYIIKRPVGAWMAMLEAGVLQLSEAVDVEMIECGSPAESTAWERFIRSRLPLFVRVFAANEDLNIAPDMLKQMRFFEVDSLVLSYKLNFMNQIHQGEQEEALAHWQKENNTLYVVRETRSSGEVARELSFAICPDGSASQLASGFKEVLQAESIEEAERNLDELGFPPREQEIGQVNGGVEFGMGGTETGDEWTPPSPTPPNPPVANDDDPSGQSPESEPDVEPVNPIAGGGQGSSTGSSRGARKPGTGRTVTRGHSRSDKVSRKIKQRTRGQRVTYVEHDELDEVELEQRERAESKAKLTGDKAEKWIVQFESSRGRMVRRMPPNNPGYDIESVDPETGEVFYIEVKGTEELWDGYGVTITPTQYEFAKEHGDSFWLYVVEDVCSESPQVYRIKNPVGRINQYAFNYGWRNLAEGEKQHDVAEEQPLDDLVNELKACTDEVFQEIIDYCFMSDLPLPEVGYESMNEAGEVIDEELELAWPDLKVGVYAEDDFDASGFESQGWQIFSSDVANDLDMLGTALNEEYHE